MCGVIILNSVSVLPARCEHTPSSRIHSRRSSARAPRNIAIELSTTNCSLRLAPNSMGKKASALRCVCVHMLLCVIVHNTTNGKRVAVTRSVWARTRSGILFAKFVTSSFFPHYFIVVALRCSCTKINTIKYTFIPICVLCACCIFLFFSCETRSERAVHMKPSLNCKKPTTGEHVATNITHIMRIPAILI